MASGIGRGAEGEKSATSGTGETNDGNSRVYGDGKGKGLGGRRFVWFIWLISFVWFISFLSAIEPNEPKKLNEPEEPDEQE